MKNFATFLGTGAAMTLGLGVIPVRLKIRNLITGLAPVEWEAGFLADTAVAGGIIDAAGTYTPQTAAQGVVPVIGGTLITTAATSSQVLPGVAGNLKVNYAGSATLFYMDAASTGLGHFNAAPTSGCGQGSKITLAWRDINGNPQQYQGRIAYVNTTFVTASYVGLSPHCPSIPATGATIVHIGPQYDFITAPAGLVMPDGVKLINTTYMTPAVKMGIWWE